MHKIPLVMFWNSNSVLESKKSKWQEGSKRLSRKQKAARPNFPSPHLCYTQTQARQRHAEERLVHDTLLCLERFREGRKVTWEGETSLAALENNL